MVRDKGINTPHGHPHGCMNSPVEKGIDGKSSPPIWVHRPGISDIIATITQESDGGGRCKELGLESSLTTSPAFRMMRSNSNRSWDSCSRLGVVVAIFSSMDMLLDATQEEECGNG